MKARLISASSLTIAAITLALAGAGPAAAKHKHHHGKAKAEKMSCNAKGSCSAAMKGEKGADTKTPDAKGDEKK